MAKNGVLIKILAITGTVLVWLPVLAPVFFSLPVSLRSGVFHFDYLLPAELFPVALVGGGLLLAAALIARSRRRLIGWGLAIAAALLVGSQALAVITGLASGETEPTGWPMVIVLTALGIYVLALMMIGIGGVLLVRDLFRLYKTKTNSAT